MSDYGKPINTLPVKGAGDLSQLDSFIGVSAGDEPAGFQATLDALIANIIGPVHENANGSYVRLENGLQVCWVSGTTGNISSAAGSVYVSGSVPPGSWPAPFINTPVIAAAAQSNAGEAVWLAVGDGRSASARPRVWGLCWKSLSSGANWQIIAIGRWK